MWGYYRAHADYFAGGPPDNLSAPPEGQKFYYDMSTGKKLPVVGDNARADYIQGYKLGWQDAKKGVFQVDC
jgi:hypothetical protein